MNLVRHFSLPLGALALICATTAVSAAQPNASTTGPTTPEAQLRRISGLTITEDGTVLEGVYVSGTINVSANNVTIRDFKIETSSSYGIQTNNGATNLLLEDGEISGMASAAVYGGNFTARRLYVHDSGADGFKPTNNVVIEDSWVEKMGYLPESHADGVQMVSGRNVILRGNNFNMANQPGFNNSQVIIIQTNNGPVDTILIEQNWINGGGASIQIRDKDTGYGAPTNVGIRNNRFGADAKSTTWVLDGNVDLCGNVWDANGQLISGQSTCSGGSAPPGTILPSPPAAVRVN